MIHLSGVDASFLHLETPEMPMHVGSLHILDLPKDYQGDFFEDVMKHVGSRLHLASVFERKLAQMPFEMSNPVWVDDDDVDLEYHLRRVVLSKPGTFKQLEQYVGRLHSTLLDRSRPLWEMFVFEGLQSGQVALYAKVHHAAIDGQAGVALAKALYDITAEPRAVRAPRARQRANQYQLGVAELATAAMQNTVQQYVKLITTLPNAVRAMATVAMPAFTQIGKIPQLQLPNFADLLKPGMGMQNLLPNMMSGMMGSMLPNLMPTVGADGSFGLPSGLGFGPRTPLNVSITNQRAFAGRSVSLAESKTLAKRAGVSLNDIVMAACASALRRYMHDLGITLDKAMTAAVPVSLREAGNTDPNNQVTLMLATLATDMKDPLDRLRAIHASTTSSKELTGAMKAAIPTDFPSFGAPWIMTGLATLFGRSKITDQIPPIANVAISNVPGVPVPLYIAGARMATYFPVSIPAHGCALNITVQSYNGALDYGLTACRRAVPDVDDLADYIVEAHAELATLIMALPVPASAAKPDVKPAQPAATAATPRTEAVVPSIPAALAQAPTSVVLPPAAPTPAPAAVASNVVAFAAKPTRGTKRTPAAKLVLAAKPVPADKPAPRSKVAAAAVPVPATKVEVPSSKRRKAVSVTPGTKPKPPKKPR
jgi:diacylglycerol O-acyltransferase / wax synthase